jgi:arsenical pump membrane protein
MSKGGKAVLAGIIATAVLLIAMSAFDLPLGLPACIAGPATALVRTRFIGLVATGLKSIRG